MSLRLAYSQKSGRLDAPSSDASGPRSTSCSTALTASTSPSPPVLDIGEKFRQLRAMRPHAARMLEDAVDDLLRESDRRAQPRQGQS